MNDDLDEIKRLLKQSPPIPPSEEAKKAAITRAMEAFDQKISTRRQGIDWLNRLMDTANAVQQTLIRSLSMKKILAYATILCTCLIASVLFIPAFSTKQKIAQESSEIINPAKLPAKTPQPTPAPVQLGPPQPAGSHEQIKGLKENFPNQDGQNQPSRELQQDLFFEKSTKTAAAPKPKLKDEEQSLAPLPQSRAVNGLGKGGREGIIFNACRIDIAPPQSRDQFESFKENPVTSTLEAPVSTFSIDVDTASYSFLRASIQGNTIPPKDAIRVEEMINYFPYEYELPESKSEPFKATVSVLATPWNPGTKLMHIGIKGYDIPKKDKPHSNLVFLIDTSGSMNQPNKLPLVLNSMKLLLDTLQPSDTVAIVTYAGNAGTALEPTPMSQKKKIVDALNNLSAHGSTAGAEGIRQAYILAEKNFDPEGVNRVILATDGDFNVGITDKDELKKFIEKKRKTGIFLSVLGFGMGNYNDALMQALAQNGNGNAAYIDSLNEARKVMVEEAGSTLFTIAKDVKIQVEFNPDQVAEYRLIGYETRLLKREDFNNDKIDAGDIGAGHSVTAIYEITPTNSKTRMIDPLRYQKNPEAKPRERNESSSEYAFLKIRYKLPDSDTSKLITTPVDKNVEFRKDAMEPQEARFAIAVAAFGQLLRGDSYTKDFTYDDVIQLAESARGKDSFGYRAEFISLVRLAKSLPSLQPLNQEDGQTR